MGSSFLNRDMSAPVSKKVTEVPTVLKMNQRTILLFVFVVLLCSEITSGGFRKQNCGLTCYSWKKCKNKLNGLINTGGNTRPGQSGNTGQLFFNKCGDPPGGCECKYESPTVGPPKPKMPRMIMEFVNHDAEKWISNLVELV